MDESDISTYGTALVATLRSASPAKLRELAATWGPRLGNPGLKQLATAPDHVVERRMWMMIRDRPDLDDLHPAADAWLAKHS